MDSIVCGACRWERDQNLLYKGNENYLSLSELDDSSTLHETCDLLIVSPRGMILEEVSLSFLPFSPHVVQLIHGGQMTANHLLSSADKRVEFWPGRRQQRGPWAGQSWLQEDNLLFIRQTCLHSSMMVIFNLQRFCGSCGAHVWKIVLDHYYRTTNKSHCEMMCKI